MRPVALERGVAEVVVEKRVGPEARGVRLAGRVVQEAPKKRKRVSARQDPGMEGVLELHDKRVDLLSEPLAPLLEIGIQPEHGPSRR